MIPYILHVSILLSLFFCFYWLLLRNETLYKLNRVFLSMSIICSLAMPLLHIPADFSLREKLFDQNQLVESNLQTDGTTSAVTSNPDPLMAENGINSSGEISATKSTGLIGSLSQLIKQTNAAQLLWIVYLVGLAIFTLAFLIQFFILFLKRSKLEFIQDGRFKIYELTEDNAPFSFLNWIFINPTKYDLDTYNQIIEHEKIHVAQKHYIDKMVAELAVILQWFNPFAWMYRTAIDNNLEFLTDGEMLDKGVEVEQYQMSLLKLSVPNHALNLTTNYNESFLSRRIKMMDNKKSSAKSSWKYLMVLPILILSVLSMNAVIPSKAIPGLSQSENQNNSSPEQADKISEIETSLEQGESELQAEPIKARDKQSNDQVQINTNTNHSSIVNPVVNLPEDVIETGIDPSVGNTDDGNSGSLSPINIKPTFNSNVTPSNTVNPNLKQSFQSALDRLGYKTDDNTFTLLVTHIRTVERLTELDSILDQMDYKKRKTADQLLLLADNNVDQAFIDGLREVKPRDFRLAKVIEAKQHNVTPALVKMLKEEGKKQIDLCELSKMADKYNPHLQKQKEDD